MGFSLGNILSGGAALLNPVGLLAGAASMGSDIYSAYQGSQNVKDTNAQNLRIAQEGNAASAAQAREQMAFQERMSSTSHQRETADLKASGLNPLLSLNSGASTPAGSMGSVTSPTMEAPPSELAGVGGSVRELMRNRADIRNMDALARKNSADADVAEYQRDYVKDHKDDYFTARVGPVATGSARAINSIMRVGDDPGAGGSVGVGYLNRLKLISGIIRDRFRYSAGNVWRDTTPKFDKKK